MPALSKVRATLWAIQNLKAYLLITRVRNNGHTFLTKSALINLYKQVQQIERDKLSGVLVEAGTALGGSAAIIAAAKHKQRGLWLYDVFEMIPPPSDRDGNDAHARYDEIRSGQALGTKGKPYYGYVDDLQVRVLANLYMYGHNAEVENIHLVKGYFNDTLHIEQTIALAHIDCDWYDSVIVCLERITPYLEHHGVLVIDDYFHWSGCRAAVDEFFAGRAEEFDFVWGERLNIVRR